MEVLSDILHGLRTSGSVYFCDALQVPWSLPYTDEDRAIFHLVRQGQGAIEVEGLRHTLETGDFVFIAPGVDHRLFCDDSPHAQTLLLCGYCRFDAMENDALLRALPGHVLIRKDEFEAMPWLQRTLEHLSAEYLSRAPGSELTVNKLTEVLLVQLLRADFGRHSDVGIVAALEDQRLARALTAIHAAPGEPWTLQSAADVAAMSRSGFARRFTSVIKQGFFDYLTRLRMRHARELLRQSGLPVPLIAERVGYQSDVSFVGAFKKLHGQTPRAYRLGAEP